MRKIIKFILLFWAISPIFVIAQTDATFSMKKGDDMFKETRYADALRYYYDALENQEEEIPGLQTKIEKTEHCKILMDKILQAHEYGWNEDEEKYLRQLYKIHPSKLLKLKIDEFDEQRREQEKEIQEQEASKITRDEYEEDDVVFIVVESMPEFPGGQPALFQYLSENVKYPVLAQENGIQGRVICQFVVNRDGSISNVEVVRSGGDPSLDKEAIRVIKSMPRWKPGKQRGKTVRVKYTVPVNFKLQ